MPDVQQEVIESLPSLASTAAEDKVVVDALLAAPLTNSAVIPSAPQVPALDPIAAHEASLPPPRIPAPEPPSPTNVNRPGGQPPPWEDWRNMLPGTPEFPVYAARDDRHFGEGWCGGGPVLNTLCPSCEYRGPDNTCAGPVPMELVRDVGKYVKCNSFRSLLVQG